MAKLKNYNMALMMGATMDDVRFDDLEEILDSNGNEILEFDEVASATNHIVVKNAATAGSPVIYAGGEADTGINFENSEGEEILKLDSIATSVNEITIKSAATGNFPIIAATGEADTGIQFENSESEEILKLDAIATAVNELTVSNAATGNNPKIAATGSDANISLDIDPKGTGTVDIGAADDLTVGEVIVPQELEVLLHAQAATAMVDQSFFVATQAYQVTKVSMVHAVAETTAASLDIQVTKDTGTAAPGGGTDLLTNNTNAGFDGRATANTVQIGTLTVTTADLQLAAGNRLSADFEAAATELVGVTITVTLKRI